MTSVTREILTADERLLGLDVGRLFDFTQTSDENLHKKPSGEFFDTLINRLSITDPSRVVYVGDELKNGYAARAAGIRFVGVQTGMATQEEFANEGFISVPNVSDIEFSYSSK